MPPKGSCLRNDGLLAHMLPAGFFWGKFMQIVVNGQDTGCADDTTLLELLQQRGNDAARVVVERNGQIVPSAEYAATALAEGDRLELVHFVGGG